MTGAALARTVRAFRSGDEEAVLSLELASLAAQPVPGFGRGDVERSVAQLGAEPAASAVALDDGEVVGICTPRFDILTVHPDHRRRGHGRRLIAAGLEIVRARGLAYLRLYAQVTVPATRAFVDAMGLTYHSSLWQFRLPGDAAVPEPAFPPEVAIRGLRPDEDLDAYVELLSTSFADHPTPVSWSIDIVRHVHSLPSFDPSDVLLVTPRDEPDRLIAFTRIALLTEEPGATVGDVRLIGVLPAWRGHGLATQLLRWGVGRLRARGAESVTLSVEALNERATRIYRTAGFTPETEWPHYVLPA